MDSCSKGLPRSLRRLILPGVRQPLKSCVFFLRYQDNSGRKIISDGGLQLQFQHRALEFPNPKVGLSKNSSDRQAVPISHFRVLAPNKAPA